MTPRGIWPNVDPEVFRLAHQLASAPDSPLAALSKDLIGGAVSYRIWYAHAASMLKEKQAGRLYSICALCGGRVGGHWLSRHKRADNSGWDHALCHGSPLFRPDEKFDRAEHRAAVRHAIATGQVLA